MKSRAYTKQVKFYQTEAVADGYGGSTVSETLIATSWANIITPKNYDRLTALGITDPTNTIILKLRYRSDIDYNAVNQHILYRGLKYIIKNAPTNIDFMDVDIEIVATRQALDSVDIIT